MSPTLPQHLPDHLQRAIDDWQEALFCYSMRHSQDPPLSYQVIAKHLSEWKGRNIFRQAVQQKVRHVEVQLDKEAA